MSPRRLSPAASLLRNSRLFSLPPPLPPPKQAFTETALFTSDTATQPFPRFQAIETTPSSLSRGDWGLKRSLPLKSTTRTSTPTLRISEIDSIDHITDFDSAADHVLTLKKWQEMAIPIQVATPLQRATQVLSHHSALEPESSPAESRPISGEPGNGLGTQSTSGSERSYRKTMRWKFKGPWLAGQTDGEFQTYLEKQIRKRRPEFLRFLRQSLSSKMVAAQRRDAMNSGELNNEITVEPSDEELQNEIIRIRNDPLLLSKAIWEFLDLPGDSPQDALYQDVGPPATHPSGGLSYLRTASHTPNHPIFGPLATQEPIQARVLETSRWKGITNRTVLGVGGIVASEDSSAVSKDLRSEPQWDHFDPDIEGGAKMWIHPQEASFDHQGRIKLKVGQASQDTISVWKSPVKGGNTTDLISSEFRRNRNSSAARPKTPSPQEDKILRLLQERNEDGVPSLLTSL